MIQFLLLCSYPVFKDSKKFQCSPLLSMILTIPYLNYVSVSLAECGSPEHVKANCHFMNYNNGFMRIEAGRGRGRGREPFRGGEDF